MGMGWWRRSHYWRWAQTSQSTVMRSGYKVRRKTAPQFLQHSSSALLCWPWLASKDQFCKPWKVKRSKDGIFAKVFFIVRLLRTGEPSEMNASGQPDWKHPINGPISWLFDLAVHQDVRADVHTHTHVHSAELRMSPITVEVNSESHKWFASKRTCVDVWNWLWNALDFLMDCWTDGKTLVWSPRGEHACAPSKILSLFLGFQYFQDKLMEKMK